MAIKTECVVGSNKVNPARKELSPLHSPWRFTPEDQSLWQQSLTTCITEYDNTAVERELNSLCSKITNNLVDLQTYTNMTVQYYVTTGMATSRLHTSNEGKHPKYADQVIFMDHSQQLVTHSMLQNIPPLLWHRCFSDRKASKPVKNPVSATPKDLEAFVRVIAGN